MSDEGIVETFPVLLRRALGDRLRPGIETFPEDFFAPDAVFEYPFAPPGLEQTFTGKEAIIGNFLRVRKYLALESFSAANVIECRDPNTVVLEANGTGRSLVTNERYDQRYISVITVRDGLIVLYRDYWNPLNVIQAVEGGCSPPSG